MNCYKKKHDNESNGALYTVIAFALIILAGCAASVIPDKNTKDKSTEYNGYLSEHERVVDMLSDKVESLSGGDAVALASVLTVVPPKGHEAPFSRVDKFVVYSNGQNAQTDTEVDEDSSPAEKGNASIDKIAIEATKKDGEPKADAAPVKTIWPEYKKK